MTVTNHYSRPCEFCGGRIVIHLHKPDVTAAVASLTLCPTCDPPCGWCAAEKGTA